MATTKSMTRLSTPTTMTEIMTAHRRLGLAEMTSVSGKSSCDVSRVKAANIDLSWGSAAARIRSI